MSAPALKSTLAAATIVIGMGLFSGQATALPAQPGAADAIGHSIGSSAELVRHRSWHRPRPVYKRVRVCRASWWHGRKITRCHWERRPVRWRR